MITVGMDVHVRNSYLHVTDDAGDVRRHGRCPNTMADLAEFHETVDRALSTPELRGLFRELETASER